jgi:hypothetical protein
LSQKESDVNLVLDGSAVIAGKPSRDPNRQIISFGVEMMAFGRDCGIGLREAHSSEVSGRKEP